MGTITGIGDLDPVRWTNSQWRSVKVKVVKSLLSLYVSYFFVYYLGAFAYDSFHFCISKLECTYYCAVN